MKPLQFIEARSAANRLRSSKRKAGESSRRSAAATEEEFDWFRPGESTKNRDARLAAATKASSRHHRRSVKQHHNIGVQSVKAGVDDSTDYSKLRFLGQFLAEYKIRKRKDIKGQKTFDFPEPKPKRRKKAAVPRRREGDKDSKGRAIDKPTERRKKGFTPETEGTRAEDVPGHKKREADAAETTAQETEKREKRGKRYSRAGQAYATYRVAKALLPRPRLPKPKPLGPNVRTGGTEGTAKL